MSASIYSPDIEVELRIRAAIDDGLEQLAKEWTAAEVAVVLEDAATVIEDLRMYAEVERLQRSVDVVTAAQSGAA